MYLTLKKSNKVSVDTMTKTDKLFVQMVKSMRKSVEQLADINRCASYTNSYNNCFNMKQIVFTHLPILHLNLYIKT